MPTRSTTVVSLLLVAAATAAAQDVVPQYPRTVLIAFDPIIESQGGGRLHNVCGWNDPGYNTDNYCSDLQSSSHGDMNYRRQQTIIADEFPIHTDGFRYTDEGYMTCYYAWSGWHTTGTDYKAQCRDYDLARKADAGMVDEVLIQAMPFTGYWESTMCGRGGYWCNSGPQVRIASSKIFIMMGFNYERGIGEMLEDYGHRSESILNYTYGGGTNTWTTFTRYDLNYPGNAACGNVHFAPNSESDYDWGNPRYVWSTCQDWLDNFPSLTGSKIWVNCSEWGNGDIRLHHVWWFTHMPHVAGSLNSRLNNWWEYMQNFNSHSESGGGFPTGGSPPPAFPYEAPQRSYTASAGDNWCPRVSAAGQIVWQGWDGHDYEIYSSNLDGSDPVQITWNDTDDEAPQINSSGRVVWQAHDGQDYEIFSANADGTDLVQITDNTTNDWHPQINNAGQIVWDHFDGTDYEIYSANADGTNVVQITNNSATSGRPRDDVWPQINNASPARVVWFGWSGSNWQIYSASVNGTNLVNVSNDARESEYPQINDAGRVVWQSFYDDTNAEILSANATGGTVTRLTSNTVEDWWPQINNLGRVVWMSRVGGDWEINTRLADGSDSVQALTNNATPDMHPQLDDSGRIVWQGFDGHDWEIYLWYVGTVYQVTDNDYDDRWPVLGPDVIAWHAESGVGPTGRTSQIWAAGEGTVDSTPPALVSVQPRGHDQVRIVFSEPVAVATAENPANYNLAPPVAVTGATLAANQQTLILDTAGFTSGTTYTLTVNNVTDVAGNPIAADTQATFEYVEHARVTSGLIALYDFEDGLGTTVHDVSQVGTPLNLTIGDAGAVHWVTGGLVLDAPVTVASPGAATKIYNACVPTSEVTLEAWAAPADTTQYGPAILETMSSGYARNFSLGQGTPDVGSGTTYNARLRTSATGSGGASLTTPPDQATLALQHVVYTRTATGTATIYVDGSPVTSESLNGSFSSWSATYRFVVGNEITGGQPWLGELQLLAVYSRALSPAEVTQNYLAGPKTAADILPGDLNCDGSVNFGDINPFVQIMTNLAGWQAAHPGCPTLNGDINGDGSVNFGDINPFVALLTGH